MNSSDPDFNTTLHYVITVNKQNINRQNLVFLDPLDVSPYVYGAWVSPELFASNLFVLANTALNYEELGNFTVVVSVHDNTDLTTALYASGTMTVQVIDVNDMQVLSIVKEAGDNSAPAVGMATAGNQPFLVSGKNFGMTQAFLDTHPTYVQQPPVVTYGGPANNRYTAANCSYVRDGSALGNTVVRRGVHLLQSLLDAPLLVFPVAPWTHSRSLTSFRRVVLGIARPVFVFSPMFPSLAPSFPVSSSS